jgi:hypothetical protein
MLRGIFRSKNEENDRRMEVIVPRRVLWFLHYQKHEQFTEDEMGEACNTHGDLRYKTVS